MKAINESKCPWELLSLATPAVYRTALMRTQNATSGGCLTVDGGAKLDRSLNAADTYLSALNTMDVILKITRCFILFLRTTSCPDQSALCGVAVLFSDIQQK